MPDRQPSRLELPADPTAVGRARAWLAGRLGDWSPDGLATVQLLLSELVTNALLHTSDVITVEATRDGTSVEVQVTDRSPSKPVIKSYQMDAATGRGLHLVEALAESWGVRVDESHKVVWFCVVDGASRARPARGQGPSTRPELARQDGRAAASPPGSVGGPEVTVRLRGLPVGTYLEVEEHHDALMREFVLLLRPGVGPAEAKASPRLVALASTLIEQFGVGNEQRREQVESAYRAGLPTVDVVMLFPSGSGAQVLTTVDQLDEVDAFCRRGELLTPPSSPAVTRFRRWYSEEIVRQLGGAAPTSWPYPIAGTTTTSAPLDGSRS